MWKIVESFIELLVGWLAVDNDAMLIHVKYISGQTEQIGRSLHIKQVASKTMLI